MRPQNLALVTALALLLLAVPAASAHKTVYTADNKVKVTWGFLGEPAVTMTKTGLDLILTDNATGAPINGAEKTLKVELHYGDEEVALSGFKAQFGAPGKYTDVVTLTKPGIYVLHLAGTINGSDVDMEIPAAHEVEAIDDTYFPELASANASDAKVRALEAKVTQLEAKMTALEAKVKTQTETPATVTPQAPAKTVPGAGALGALAVLGIAAVVLARRR